MFMAVADGLADDRVRAMDAPGEAIAVGRGIDLVFLGIIEVLDVQPRLLLAQRRLGQRPPPEHSASNGPR